MTGGIYFVVINDNPFAFIRGPCITGSGDDLDFYRGRREALDRRDQLREEYDNPAINVYRVKIHQGCIKRDAEVEA